MIIIIALARGKLILNVDYHCLRKIYNNPSRCITDPCGYLGDGVCNMEFFNEECQFDYGDCDMA